MRIFPDANELRERNGSLPSFTSLGAYTILYYTKDYEYLCADCATSDLDEEEEIVYDVYYEGPVVQCSDCNKDLESAYGDPNDDEEES